MITGLACKDSHPLKARHQDRDNITNLETKMPQVKAHGIGIAGFCNYANVFTGTDMFEVKIHW
jgi:dienelactone hydrolase